MTDQQIDNRSTTQIVRDARREAALALEVGSNTVETLAAQGDQMARVEKKLDKMEAELTMSDKILTSMSGWAGAVTSIFSSTKKPNAAAPVVPVQVRSEPRPSTATRKDTASSRVALRTDESRPTPTAELDADLDGLLADVNALKSVAKAQNAELQRQNQQLDVLRSKTEQVQNHAERTTNRVKRIS